MVDLDDISSDDGDSRMPRPPKRGKRSAEEEIWATLNRQCAEKTCPELVAIRWVAENQSTPVEELKDVPSRLALNWLKWVREDASNAADFWKSSVPKLLPDKKQLEAEERFRDDGRRIVEAIERVRELGKKAKRANIKLKYNPRSLENLIKRGKRRPEKIEPVNAVDPNASTEE
jgi:hypothetical protein